MRQDIRVKYFTFTVALNEHRDRRVAAIEEAADMIRMP
jgi:hypothetical protein